MKLTLVFALLHELDDCHRSANFAEDNDADEHDEAVELLVDQVEGKHAVNESSREEYQTEEDCDR